MARQKIDHLLTEVGWVLQDRDAFDRNAALGVAVREFPLPTGFCDYLLFVGGKAAGVIEAKRIGVTLSGVADQSEKYALRPPEHLARWDEFLNYHYESTGEETFFRNLRDPKARSRRQFAFHRPDTLHDMVCQSDSPGVKANVLFFDKRPASREVQTKELWVYDYRTNVHKTLKTKRLTNADFDDFVQCYHERKETERFRRFSYDDLAQRDKLNLDIFWLKDDSLEDIDNLPEPDVLATEIVENLEAALEQFRSVSQELSGSPE